jgi:hypothetical protein
MNQYSDICGPIVLGYIGAVVALLCFFVMALEVNKSASSSTMGSFFLVGFRVLTVVCRGCPDRIEWSPFVLWYNVPIRMDRYHIRSIRVVPRHHRWMMVQVGVRVEVDSDID